MKTLAFLLLMVSGIATAQFGHTGPAKNPVFLKASEPIRYPMSGVAFESEKFKKVFLSVKQMQESRNKKRLPIFTIVQNISAGKYLVKDPKNRDSFALLEYPGAGLVADDTRVEAAAVLTDRIYQYTTVLGAKKTIPVYEKVEIEEERAFDELEFREKLIAGTTYLIPMEMPPANCKECNGFGKVPGTTKYERRGDAKKFCDVCKGNGKVIIKQVFEVCWEK